MHARVLSDVERRQVKSERAHSAHEPPYQEIAGMPSPVQRQAIGGEADIGEQFIGILIGVGPALVGRLEPLADLAEEHAIRHAIVARRRQRLRARQDGAVGVDARCERRAHAHSVRALAQGLGELSAFREIGRDDHLLMAVQCLADGLAMHVRHCRPCRRPPTSRSAGCSARPAVRLAPSRPSPAPPPSPRRTAAPPDTGCRSDRTARARAHHHRQALRADAPRSARCW